MVRSENLALIKNAVQSMNGWVSVTDIARRCQKISRSTVAVGLKQLAERGELNQRLICGIVHYSASISTQQETNRRNWT